MLKAQLAVITFCNNIFLRSRWVPTEIIEIKSKTIYVESVNIHTVTQLLLLISVQILNIGRKFSAFLRYVFSKPKQTLNM
jgi:hypothetical protein